MTNPPRLARFLSALALWTFVGITPPALAGQYDTQIAQAVTWLAQTQNLDGSWGSPQELRHLLTSEVVGALRATNNQASTYFGGVTWLQNHDAPNIDYKARRVLALAPHGSNLASERAQLLAAQNTLLAGNRGWGLTPDYHSAAIDTALTLQALLALGTGGPEVGDAIGFLTAAQLTASGETGWNQGAESLAEPVSTALTLLALVERRTTTPNLNIPIANAVSVLASKVVAGSPAFLKALAAYALLKESASSAHGAVLLSAVVADRNPAGHWDSDPYATALAVRALALADTLDFNPASQVVHIPDPNLRAALLQALGKPANAVITVGDLATLTSLNLANKSIVNLAGLQFASNLTNLNVKGNRIQSLDPIKALLSNPAAQVTLNVIERDLGGDHRADILWRDKGGNALRYWFMNGAAVSAIGQYSPGPDWLLRPAALGDFNGDGKADILFRNVLSGQNEIWLINAGTVTSKIPTTTLTDRNWRVVGVADFNGDGKVDILWRHAVSGQNKLWLMDGATVTADLTVSALADVGWNVAGLGDFDGDGNADILWRHTNGQNTIWVMNGASVARTETLPGMDANWVVGGTGDFDRDGIADVVWRNSTTGDNALWLMEGGKPLFTLPIVRLAGAQWRVASVADFDGDGNADLFWTNTQTGEAMVWLMLGAEVLSSTTLSQTVAASLQIVGTQQRTGEETEVAAAISVILQLLLDD
jgi:hypothetical protein